MKVGARVEVVGKGVIGTVAYIGTTLFSSGNTTSYTFTFAVPRLGDRSFAAFAVVVPQIWNSLPADLRLVDNYARFRRLLKGLCLAETAAPSDSVSWAPCTNILTYLLLLSVFSAACFL